MTAVPELATVKIAANRRLKAGELQELVSSLALKIEFRYFYGETVADIAFTKFDAGLVPTDWTEGRVFCLTANLHWRYEPFSDPMGIMQPGYRVVYCGNGLPELCNWNSIVLEGEGWQRSETVVLLRGTRLPEQTAWLEPRTPRVLDYPWNQPDSQLGLRLANYYLNGQPQFEQWLTLEAWKGGV